MEAKSARKVDEARVRKIYDDINYNVNELYIYFFNIEKIVITASSKMEIIKAFLECKYPSIRKTKHLNKKCKFKILKWY